MLLFTEFDVFVATVRLMGIKDTESMSDTLWQNSHGFSKLLRTAKVNACYTMTGNQTHVEEWLQGV